MRSTEPRWAVFNLDNGVHVVPHDDAIEHDLDTHDCLCGPALELVPCDEGGTDWLVTHHSLDGRERSE